jgi:hypothetical protein
MYDFFTNLKNKRCCGIISTNIQCNEIIISFSPGIFLCVRHGNVFISPYHNMLYGYINDHSKIKIFHNKFFSSKIYNRNLIKKRYRKVLHKILYENNHILNKDIVNIIVEYL